jgi:hypothetical protein
MHRISVEFRPVINKIVISNPEHNTSRGLAVPEKVRHVIPEILRGELQYTDEITIYTVFSLFLIFLVCVVILMFFKLKKKKTTSVTISSITSSNLSSDNDLSSAHIEANANNDISTGSIHTTSEVSEVPETIHSSSASSINTVVSANRSMSPMSSTINEVTSTPLITEDSEVPETIHSGSTGLSLFLSSLGSIHTTGEASNVPDTIDSSSRDGLNSNRSSEFSEPCNCRNCNRNCVCKRRMRQCTSACSCNRSCIIPTRVIPSRQVKKKDTV